MKSHIEKSRDYKRSGIVPFYFNTLHLTGSVHKLPNAHYDPEMVLHDLDIPEITKQVREKLQLNSLADRPTNDLSSVVGTNSKVMNSLARSSVAEGFTTTFGQFGPNQQVRPEEPMSLLHDDGTSEKHLTHSRS